MVLNNMRSLELEYIKNVYINTRHVDNMCNRRRNRKNNNTMVNVSFLFIPNHNSSLVICNLAVQIYFIGEVIKQKHFHYS